NYWRHSAGTVAKQVTIASIALGGDAYRDSSAVQTVGLPPGPGVVQFTMPLAAGDRADSYEVIIPGTEREPGRVEAREAGAGVGFEVNRAYLRSGRREFELYGVAAAGRRLIAFQTVDFR